MFRFGSFAVLVTVFGSTGFGQYGSTYDGFRYEEQRRQIEDQNRALDRIADAADYWRNDQMIRDIERREGAYYQAELAWQKAQQVQMQAAQQLTLAANYIRQLEKLVTVYRKEVASLQKDNKFLAGEIKILLAPGQPEAEKNGEIPADLYNAYIKGDKKAVDDLLRKYVQADAKTFGLRLPPAIASSDQSTSNQTNRNTEPPKTGTPDTTEDHREKWVSKFGKIRFALVGNGTWEEYDKENGNTVGRYKEESRTSTQISLKSMAGNGKKIWIFDDRCLTMNGRVNEDLEKGSWSEE